MSRSVVADARRSTEFGLVVMAAVITAGAYTLASLGKNATIPPILVPFLVATLVRIAQGSGTVAMITAASVSAPLVTTLGIDPLVAALACTAGSMVFSYFNDSYFWVVTRFTWLQGTDALKDWSGITTAVWAGSIPLLFIADLLLI